MYHTCCTEPALKVEAPTIANSGTGCEVVMEIMSQEIKLPSVPEREDPIYKPAKNGNHSAVFIFVHGLADSAQFIQGENFSQQARYQLLTVFLQM